MAINQQGTGRRSRPAPWPNESLQQPITYEIITPPAITPITLQQAKDQARITTTLDDVEITLFIEAATRFFENYTNRILINTGFRTYFDLFKTAFSLRRSKFQSLQKFDYLVSDIETPVPAANFYVTDEKDYSRIIFKTFNLIPQDKDDRQQSIIVEFTVGYGVLDTLVPPDIKIALLQHVTNLYFDRGDCSCNTASISALPPMVKSIYDKYRIGNLTENIYQGGGGLT